MRNKKGILFTDETIGLIIAIAGLGLLILLFYALSPSFFDRADETSKSYFDTLIEQIAVADEGFIGEVFLFPTTKSEHYIIYFGEQAFFFEADKQFNYKGDLPEHGICSCHSLQEGFACNYCSELSKPFGDGSSQIIARRGDTFQIVSTENSYEFTRSEAGINDGLDEPSLADKEKLEEILKKGEEDAVWDFESQIVNYDGLDTVSIEVSGGRCPGIPLRDIPDFIRCETKHSFCKLTPDALGLLISVNDVAESKGYELIVTSAFRTYEQQAALWKKFGMNPKRVARPSCDSPHATGNAVDVYLYDSQGRSHPKTLEEIMTSLGWVRYQKESWHFECCGTDRHRRAGNAGVSVIV